MNINVNNIKRAYSGKPGCMCGCNGNYTTNPAAMKRAFNRVVNDPNVKLDFEANCVYVSTDTRTNVVYFND